MLVSIRPPVSGGPSVRSWRRHWFGLALLHSLGNVLSAAAVGVGLMALAWGLHEAGRPLALWMPWLVALLGLVYVPRELGLTEQPPLLQSARQVPRRWALVYPPWLAALLYGLGLGNGFFTRLVVPTFYLLVLWPFLCPGSPWPLAMWLVYGLVRSAPLWWLAGTTRRDELEGCGVRLMTAVFRWGKWMHRANAVLLAGVAGWLLLGRPPE